MDNKIDKTNNKQSRMGNKPENTGEIQAVLTVI